MKNVDGGSRRREARAGRAGRAARSVALASLGVMLATWPVHAQLAATPSPTPADSVAPLTTPAPTPVWDDPTPAPQRKPVPVVSASAAPSSSAASKPAEAAPTPKLLSTTAGSFEFSLASPAMAVTNLSFVDTATVASGTATLTVLRFTADGVSLSGFTEREPCATTAGGVTWQVVHTVPGTATATLTGPITLLATSLSYTTPGGPTVTFDAVTPPLVPGVLVPTGTLPQVELTATSLTAASMTAPQLSASVATC